jgi:Recombination endonuclease VII
MNARTPRRAGQDAGSALHGDAARPVSVPCAPAGEVAPVASPAGPRQPGARAGGNPARAPGSSPVADAMSENELVLFELDAAVVAERRCRRCMENKPIATSFDKGKQVCRQCRGRQSRAWRTEQGPNYRRQESQWTLYRLTWEDYQEILAKQNQLCAICHKPFADNPRLIHVDHKHGCEHEGKGQKSCRDCVRGILCHRCNIFVGWIETDYERVGDLLDYLGLDGGLIWAYIMRDIGYELISTGEALRAESGVRDA